MLNTVLSYLTPLYVMRACVLLALYSYCYYPYGPIEFGERGGLDSSAYVHLSVIMVCARAAPKEGVLLALPCRAFARLVLAELELVLRSRRVVAL